MKKTAAALLTLLFFLLLLTPCSADALVSEDALTLAAPSAVLMEKETGTLIYAKNAHERRVPASVTKVMTLLLIAEAVDSGVISTDDMVTGSAKASSMGGSQIWLEEGEQLSVSDMIKCIAVVSANDCAVAMAEHLCGSEEAFVARMNERAAELGLEDTHFTNCTGLFDDAEHYTSAYDIAVMSRELISHEWIKNYTTIWMDSIRGGASELTNTNKLVYYYEGCTGLKTGFTSDAMYCLSATAERDGVEFIAVVLHGESIESRNNDAKALLNYGFANYTLCPLSGGVPLPPVAVELGEAQSVQPVYAGSGSILIGKSLSGQISYSLELSPSVKAPVKAGDALGTMTVSSPEGVLASVPVVSGVDCARLGVGGIFVKMLRSIVSGS